MYTNDFKEEQIPNTIRHLSDYREKLSSRRECKFGKRKWYELQWGRKKEDFFGEKIIFPYKSSGNNFYLDKEGYFFSADVYFLKKKNDKLSYNDIINYLNSSFIEFLI